jgi:two-component system OmpR family response regulator
VALSGCQRRRFRNILVGEKQASAERQPVHSGMHVLLIEDDEETAAFLSAGLAQGGHHVDHIVSGRDGVIAAAGSQYDVLVVDRMLPGMDGLSVVKALRSANVKTPVLFLTAVAGLDDRVEGLTAGGDDYLAKPFALSEVMARLAALARRPPLSQVQTVLRVADLEMDLLSRRVVRASKVIDLQRREFQLLEYLMRNAGRVVTRSMLLENVWEYNFEPRTKIVETHVSRLRAKINIEGSARLIETVRGSGYVIRAPA